MDFVGSGVIGAPVALRVPRIELSVLPVCVRPTLPAEPARAVGSANLVLAESAGEDHPRCGCALLEPNPAITLAA